jgi:hypothetical protein
MGPIRPQDPRLLTDRDVDYTPFHCCGNEGLVFLRCPACAHLMVFCYECDTVYPDLTQPAKHEGLRLTRLEDRFLCPACGVPFEDFYFLMTPQVDKYLTTAEQVIAAGAGHLLSPERRRSLDIAPP